MACLDESDAREDPVFNESVAGVREGIGLEVEGEDGAVFADRMGEVEGVEAFPAGGINREVPAFKNSRNKKVG